MNSRLFRENLTVRGVSSVAIITLLLMMLASANVVAQQGSDEPLTNTAVMKLVKAGFKEKTIVAIIQTRPNRFKMDTEGLIQLKRSGVSENIILAMLATDGSVTSSADDWSDDAFFGRKSAELGAEQSQGADIFGSSNGSRSQTKQRGAAGTNENEGNITGSATVRIIRPPTEAGGAPPKLERTPTLNNEAVIRLVEAGFSEGTIIKRIEESPAEFDLSPTKLEELHKRRVTEPIIAAMTAAMSEDKPTNPTPESEN